MREKIELQAWVDEMWPFPASLPNSVEPQCRPWNIRQGRSKTWVEKTVMEIITSCVSLIRGWSKVHNRSDAVDSVTGDYMNGEESRAKLWDLMRFADDSHVYNRYSRLGLWVGCICSIRRPSPITWNLCICAARCFWEKRLPVHATWTFLHSVAATRARIEA